ncbi:hypothetical protein CK203_017758 [Vitis vinifera]|uniref:Rubisco LSMT substrate-binding domain-containing protein n=1 Tax=Vitis vinifera TaxID=29760 RepID=A0A438JGS4_VITVI|nr:hypothetical protein CK203_017758 [Vitis vinifera]
MAEACRMFHTALTLTLPPSFSQTPSRHSQPIPRRHPIRCSISTTDTAKTSVTQKIPWGCEVDSLENAALLQKWLSDSGLPPQKMGIERVEEWSCTEAGEVLKRNSVPDWPLLATYLIGEASLMQSSRWSNYISALPRQPYSLLYWTRAELDKYLEASQIRERAIERINDVTGTYNDLRLRIFSKHPHLFPEEVETFLDYDKSSQGVVFTTDRTYQPSEQVFISYGKKSNGELLLSYGFVPREGTNPNDKVELLLSLKKSDKCYKQKSEAMKKHGLSTQDSMAWLPIITPENISMFPYTNHWLASGVNGLCLFSSQPPKSSFQIAAVASNKTTSKKDIRYPELEEQALQFILDSCEASISKYSKFLQESGSMDLDVTSPKQLNRRVFLKQLAVDLCTSERRILFRTQYILRRRLRDIRSGELRALRIFDGFRKLFK